MRIPELGVKRKSVLVEASAPCDYPQKRCATKKVALVHVPMCRNATQARMYTKLGILAEGQTRREARMDAG